MLNFSPCCTSESDECVFCQTPQASVYFYSLVLCSVKANNNQIANETKVCTGTSTTATGTESANGLIGEIEASES